MSIRTIEEHVCDGCGAVLESDHIICASNAAIASAGDTLIYFPSGYEMLEFCSVKCFKKKLIAEIDAQFA